MLLAFELAYERGLADQAQELARIEMLVGRRVAGDGRADGSLDRQGLEPEVIRGE